jgi:hypothetical protein
MQNQNRRMNSGGGDGDGYGGLDEKFGENKNLAALYNFVHEVMDHKDQAHDMIKNFGADGACMARDLKHTVLFGRSTVTGKYVAYLYENRESTMSILLESPLEPQPDDAWIIVFGPPSVLGPPGFRLVIYTDRAETPGGWPSYLFAILGTNSFVQGDYLCRTMLPIPTGLAEIPTELHVSAFTSAGYSFAWKGPASAPPLKGYDVYYQDSYLKLNFLGFSATNSYTESIATGSAASRDYVVVPVDLSGQELAPSKPLRVYLLNAEANGL